MRQVSLKLTDALYGELKILSLARGKGLSDAVRHTLLLGLSAEVANIHSGAIAQTVREVIRAEMARLQDDNSDVMDQVDENLSELRALMLGNLFAVIDTSDIEDAGKAFSDYYELGRACMNGLLDEAVADEDASLIDSGSSS